jgi:D-glycero-D-manno-heptose 1,7-bisphosphate phosphatase
MNKAVFLDRDGVINQKAPVEGEYITRREGLKILPGVADAIILLRRAGFLAIVVSNQRCVAKGLLTAADLDSMHAQMCDELATLGATIDAVYYCPHDEVPACECRKPQPGMLLAAATEHKVDLPSSWMIGDSEKDIEAGKRVGCKTARIYHKIRENVSADVRAASLFEAVQMIIRLEGTAIDSPSTNASAAHVVRS